MLQICKMRFAILSFMTFLLSGCFHSTPVDIAVNAAQNSVVALEKTLPSACKSEGVIAQINTIKTTITEIKERCLAENKILEEQKTKWQILFLGAVGIIVLLLWRKFRI